MKTGVKPAARPESLTDAFWIGTNLNRLRLEQGLTLESLARKAGITPRRLRDLENAARDENIFLTTLSALAGALNVETADLFKRHKDVEAFALQI